MDPLHLLRSCLSRRNSRQHRNELNPGPVNEKALAYKDDPEEMNFTGNSTLNLAAEDTADKILSTLLSAEKIDINLQNKIRMIVWKGEQEVQANSSWWAERVANAILAGLEALVEAVQQKEIQLTGAMLNAFTEGENLAMDFKKDHPVAATAIVVVAVIAFAVAVVLLAPEILEALGFVARGPLLRVSLTTADENIADMTLRIIRFSLAVLAWGCGMRIALCAPAEPCCTVREVIDLSVWACPACILLGVIVV